MQKKKNRIFAVLAANDNPLVYSADLDKHCLVNSGRRVDHRGFSNMVMPVRPVGNSTAYQYEGES